MNVSVKVMRSYDYCHFEIALSEEYHEEDHPHMEIAFANELRKKAARLVDRAVEQYKEMVAHLDHQKNILVPEARELRRFAEKASEVPESERTPQQVAIIKTHEDYCHWRDTDYDYDDEYDDFDMPIEILP